MLANFNVSQYQNVVIDAGALAKAFVFVDLTDVILRGARLLSSKRPEDRFVRRTYSDRFLLAVPLERAVSSCSPGKKPMSYADFAYSPPPSASCASMH